MIQDVSFEQPLNAWSPIVTNESGKIMFSKLYHPDSTDLESSVTCLGISHSESILILGCIYASCPLIISVLPSFSTKCPDNLMLDEIPLSPITPPLIRVLGKLISVNLHPLNALLPKYSTPSEITTDVTEFHPLKQFSLIDLIFPGITSWVTSSPFKKIFLLPIPLSFAKP